MLGNWYFTCCIHGTPGASSAFLSILDVLRRADDERLVGTALEELGQAEALMQIYAVGPVVEAARRCESDAVRQLAAARVATVLDHVPELADQLGRLADAAIWQSSRADLAELAEKSAEAVLRRAQEPGESQPYLDLQERVAETTLLSIVRILLHANRELDSLLSPRGEEEAQDISRHALATLLENASAGAYGRLAQLLAVRILATSQEPWALLVQMWRTPGAEPDVEPDILALTAELFLVPTARNLSDEDRLSAVGGIRAEATQLRHLRRLLDETYEGRERHGRRNSRPLTDMGQSRDPNRRLALSCVLWHGALWQIASRLAPESCSSWVAATWRKTERTLANNRPGGGITTRYAGQRRRDGDNEGWLKLLRSFLIVRQDKKIELRYSQNYDKVPGYFESRLLPHLFSPWLVMSFDRRKGDDYPGARDPAAMLRLLLAATVGAELLETTRPSCPGRERILRTVAHAARVMSRFSRWLRNYADPDQLGPTALRLQVPLTSLALFARSRVADVGCGRSAQVDPAEFVNLLGNNAQLSDGARVLAWTLTGWIADGLAHAHDLDLAGRWLPLAPDVCWVWTEPGPLTDRHQAALIMRYAIPGERPDLQSLEWQGPGAGDAEGQQATGLEKARPRQLLLTSGRPWRDWGLTADLSRWDQSKRANLAIQRMGALPDPEDEPDAPFRDWADDLRSVLSGANAARVLDRFARLRLIELLEAAAVTQNHELQLLIMRVIVEFGTPYDWSRLFDHMLGQTAAPQAPPRVTQRLRLDYGRLLARRLEQREHANLTRRSLQDPRDVHRDRSKQELIRDQLATYLYEVADLADPEQAVRVRQEISALRTRRLPQAQSKLGRVRAVPDVLGDGRQVLSVPTGQAFFSTWTLRAVLRNPVNEVHDVYFQTYATRRWTSLFDPRAGTGLGPAVAGTTCIGFVLAEPTGTNPVYLVNFGTGGPVAVPAGRGPTFSPGDAVTVKLTRDTATGTISATGPLRRLALQEAADGPSVVKVTERQATGRPIAGRPTSFEPSRVEPDLSVWDPDISRSFSPLPARTRKALASIAADGSLAPVPEDLPGLLAREPTSAREPLVLAFCGYDQYGLGDAVWRFSSAPGITYDLSPSVFGAADAGELETELHSHDDPCGLLVTVRSVRLGQRVRLQLVRSAASDPVHPALQTPFDRRNLTWRSLFAGDGAQIAARGAGKWTLSAAEYGRQAPPGFPDRVDIEWQGRRPSSTEQRTEVTVTSWEPRDQRLGTVQAQAMQVSYLNWQRDPAGVLDRRLGLGKGSRLTLESVVAAKADAAGNIRCRAADGLLVTVAVESLTMAQIDDASDLNRQAVGRTVEVTSTVPWTDPKITRVRRETLPDTIRDLGSVEGILTQVPRSSEEHATACRVLFRAGGETQNALIELTDLAAIRPVFTGDKITVTIGPSGDPQAAVSNSRVFARALWTLKPEGGLVEGARYLGEVRWRGKWRTLCQDAEPGALLLWPEPAVGAGHLAKWSADAFVGGLPDTWMARNESRLAFRGKLRSDSDRGWYLCGRTSSGGGAGRSAVEGAPSLSMHPQGEYYALERDFRIRTRTVTPTRPQAEPAGGTGREAALDRLTGLPAVQVIVPERAPARVLVPELMSEGLTRASSHVTVRVDSHPYVADAPYGEDGRGRVHREDGGFVVSFEDVPPLNAELYREYLGAPVDEDMLVDSLCYVGPAVIDQNGEEQPGHLFEFGYGWTLLVPEARLRFRGQPFSSARFLLFHGDMVTQIRFLEQPTEDASPLVIDVSGVLIRAQSTSLYLQAKRHHLVHTVHARVRDQRLEVDSIEGFDEERLRDWASYRPSRVSVDPDQARMLTQRADDSDERLTFYARLDTGLFEETTGQELLFRHVKLTFDPDEGDAKLRDREVVFLRGGSLTTTRNDTFLRLHALRGFHPADIGPDIGSSLRLARRRFSVQENLLRRAAGAGKTDSFEGTVFPVRLTRQQNGVVRASLRTVPPRPLRVLRDVLRSTGNALYGAVDSWGATAARKAEDDRSEGSETLRVEVRPGVLFELPADRIVALPHNLDEGAIVRLDFEDETDRFEVEPCTYSTRRYVSDQGRPVVVLPMDGLLRPSLLRDEQDLDQDAWWVRNPVARFTVAGLPVVVASPAAYVHDESRWHAPRARAMRRLMTVPHPKVGWLGWQQSRGWTIAPSLGSAICGTLQIDGSGITMRPVDGGKQVLPWRRLSFMDASIEVILATVRERSWRYHDRVTGWWRDHEVVEQALPEQALEGSPDQRAAAGLLFFAPGPLGPSLRYPETELPYYGFPVSHLVEGTTSAIKVYAVAGASRDGDRPAGVWLELVPGQVVEVMGELMTWSGGGSSLSLGRFAWQHVAPGDEITLQAISQELSTVDRLELHGWRRGPRAAFGPRALLPVAGHDQDDGSLRLGAGAFALTYPAAEPAAAGSAWLTSDNELTPDGDPVLRREDTVLLGCDSRRRLVVLGAERYEARPDRHQPERWNEDPLRGALAGRDGSLPRTERLKDLVTAAGGAIPATIEGTAQTAQGKTAFFSFRHQQAEIRPGQLAIAQPLGLFGNTDLLLRLGQGLILMPMRDVASGAPTEAYPALAAALVQASTWIWVHQDGRGDFRTGLAKRRSRDVRFQAELAVGPEDGGPGPTGLLARNVDTQRLYWCPAGQLAHAQLSLPEIEALWITAQPPPHQRRPFRAALVGETRSDRYLSLVRGSEATAEVKRLRPGAQLRVTVRARPAGPDAGDTYLVESYATKIAMRCRIRVGNDVRVGDLLHVEVDEHRPARPRLITVVPAGGRSYRPDLPSWMLNDRPEPKQRRAEFSNFLRWRAEAGEQTLDLAGAVTPGGEPQLQRSLCHAYQASLATGASSVAAQVALRWLRAEDESAEIDLPYPLMALATLAAVCQQGRQPLMEQAGIIAEAEADQLLAAYREELSAGMARLARRAVRSVQVEALTRRWIQGRPGDSGQTWQRVNRLEAKLATVLTEADISEVLQFAHAAELAGDWEGLHIADGLKATIGRLQGLERICEDAPILMRIVGLCRMQAPDFTARRLTGSRFSAAEYQLGPLRRLVDEITLDAIDITLLPAIPLFDFARDRARLETAG